MDDNPQMRKIVYKKLFTEKYHEYTYWVIHSLKDLYLHPPIPYPWLVLGFVLIYLYRNRHLINLMLIRFIKLFRIGYVGYKLRWWPKVLFKVVRFGRWTHIRRYVRVMWQRAHLFKLIFLTVFVIDLWPIRADLLAPVPILLLLSIWLSIMIMEVRSRWRPRTVLSLGGVFFQGSQILLFLAIFPFVIGIITPFRGISNEPAYRYIAFELAPLCAFTLLGPLFNNATLIHPPGRGIMYDLDMWDFPRWNNTGSGAHADHPTSKFFYARSRESHYLHRRREGVLFYLKMCFSGTFIQHMGEWPTGVSPHYEIVPQRMAYAGGADRPAEQIARFVDQTANARIHLFGRGLNRLWAKREEEYLNGLRARPAPLPDPKLYPPPWLPPAPGISLPPGSVPPRLDMEKLRADVWQNMGHDDEYRIEVRKKIDWLRRKTQQEFGDRANFGEKAEYKVNRMWEISRDHWSYAKQYFHNKAMVRLSENADDMRERILVAEDVWNEVRFEAVQDRLVALGLPPSDSLPPGMPSMCFDRRSTPHPPPPRFYPTLTMPFYDSIINQLLTLRSYLLLLLLLLLLILLLLAFAWPLMRASGFVRIYKDEDYWRWGILYRKGSLSSRCRNWVFNNLHRLPVSLGWMRRWLRKLELSANWVLHRTVYRRLSSEVYNFHLIFHVFLTVLTAGLLAGFTFSWFEDLISTPHISWRFGHTMGTIATIEQIKFWEDFMWWPLHNSWYEGRGKFRYIFETNWNFFLKWRKHWRKKKKTRGGFFRMGWLQAEPLPELHWRGRNRKHEPRLGKQRRKYPRSVFALRAHTRLFKRTNYYLARFRLSKLITHYLLLFLFYLTIGFDFGYRQYEAERARWLNFSWRTAPKRVRELRSRKFYLGVSHYQDKIRKMNYLGLVTVVPLAVYWFLYLLPVLDALSSAI